jgi:DNA-binding beta-propeller fold protein YncE
MSGRAPQIYGRVRYERYSHKIGTDLGEMVLSDDGTALYVVLETNGTIRRLDPGTLTTVAEFQIRATAPSLGHITCALAVMRGSPGTVGAAYLPNPASSGASIAVFDDGVRRGAATTESTTGDGLLFSPDGTYLFQGNFGTVNTSVYIERAGCGPRETDRRAWKS